MELMFTSILRQLSSIRQKLKLPKTKERTRKRIPSNLSMEGLPAHQVRWLITKRLQTITQSLLNGIKICRLRLFHIIVSLCLLVSNLLFRMLDALLQVLHRERPPSRTTLYKVWRVVAWCRWQCFRCTVHLDIIAASLLSSIRSTTP